MVDSAQGMDGVFRGLSLWLAARSTRRSALGRLGGLLFGMLGFAMIPTDRRAYATSCTPVNCTDPFYCGMSGRPCETCTINSIPVGNVCPANSNQGAAWTACCPGFGSSWRCINYIDCCSQTAFSQSGLACTSFCCNQANCVAGTPAQGTTYYSPGYPNYWCTVLSITMTTCGPPPRPC